MKKLLLTITLFFVGQILFAQSRNCPMSIDLNAMQSQNPARYQRFINLEKFTTNYIKNQSSAGYRLADPNGIIIIPVVVHVLHCNEAVGTGLNISPAQIQSQIDVLNEDFRRLNANRTNTPAAFAGVASDFNFEFRLACQDPNGNTTNGVTRRFTSKSGFQFYTNKNGIANDNAIGIKMTRSGGEDPWPTDRYLNIWVGDFTDGTLGYATWPADFSTNPNVDGVVISTTAMGRVGNVNAPYDGGRTATHEVGHWLNLRHIWGDAICGDDFVADTPVQRDRNFGCPSFPLTAVNNTQKWFGPRCNVADPSSMFMNYMDYTDDYCMNTFTRGQRLRGRALFTVGGPRAAFLNNYFQVQHPGTIYCNGKINLWNPNCLQPTWSITSGVATITSVGTNQATISSTTSGTVTVRAVAGNYTSETTFNISVGTNTLIGTSSVNSNCSGNTFNALNTSLSGVCTRNTPIYFTYNITDTNYTNFVFTPVSVPSEATWSYNGRNLYVTVNTTPYSGSRSATIALVATGPCGVYKTNFTSTAVNYYSSPYSATPPSSFFCISPNPSKESVTVSVNNENLLYDDSQNLIYAIKITDSFGIRVDSFEYKDGVNSERISIQNLKQGIYTLSVFDGKRWSSERLLVEK